MSAKTSFLLLLILPGFLEAQENPFIPLRERYQWAILEIKDYHRPDSSTVGHRGAVDSKKEVAKPPQCLAFATETDKAKINVTLTLFTGGFIADLVSDVPIQGWVLKRESNRVVLGRGGAPGGNQNNLRVRVNQPYMPDFALTVFVTQDGDPAYVRLF